MTSSLIRGIRENTDFTEKRLKSQRNMKMLRIFLNGTRVMIG